MPVREGFEFVGWFDENGNQVTSMPTAFSTFMKWTARWSVEQHSITWDANYDGGAKTVWTGDADSSTADAGFGAIPTVPERAGYTFDGWYTRNGVVRRHRHRQLGREGDRGRRGEVPGCRRDVLRPLDRA